MANQILASLPGPELELLEPHLQPVTLAIRDVLHEPGSAVSNCYFVDSGLVSVLTVMQDGTSIESALAGDEGISGLDAVLGANISPTRAIVQLPGEARWLDRGSLQELLPQMPVLEASLARYAQLRLSMAYQLAACNRLHSVLRRCAFWLLQVHDRVGQDEFDLTHAFIANMLGVRRASASVAARQLLSLNLVEYRRGRVRILDRAGLEAQACECDAKLREQRLSFIASLRRD
jgi:CRP-like cAMP-binding protein